PLRPPPADTDHQYEAQCYGRPQKFARRPGRFCFRLNNNRSVLFPGQDDAKQIHRDGNVFQLSRRQFFEARFERVANLAFDIHRKTKATRPRQRLDARSDVDSVAVNVAISMDDITNVKTDFYLDMSLKRHVRIALR